MVIFHSYVSLPEGIIHISPSGPIAIFNGKINYFYGHFQ